jgi:hypothetical protein
MTRLSLPGRHPAAASRRDRVTGPPWADYSACPFKRLVEVIAPRAEPPGQIPSALT